MTNPSRPEFPVAGVRGPAASVVPGLPDTGRPLPAALAGYGPADVLRPPGPARERHVDAVLQAMMAAKASDLHLTVGLRPAVRVDGRIRSLEEFDVLDGAEIRRMVYAILTQKQRERFEADLELDASHAVAGLARFRLNVMQQRGEVAAVFRAIPQSIPTLTQLGMPPVLQEVTGLPRGLVLVTGPTGSGKSTTLASMIDVINRTRSAHIVTVEDPIEFLHSHQQCLINQREIGEDTKSFAAALKHVLRQDPDVILVGELRDLETISTALTAAETGHLVFATLHTQDAAQSVDRIIDVFPAEQQQQIRVQLAASLQCVVAQQLLPRSGRTGRVAATEVLVATAAVRNLIRDGKTHQLYSAMQAGARSGMHTMDQSLALLVRNNLVDMDQAKERCANEDDLRRLVASA